MVSGGFCSVASTVEFRKVIMDCSETMSERSSMEEKEANDRDYTYSELGRLIERLEKL